MRIIYDRSIKVTVWKRGVALNDKKIIEGIIRRDEQLFAFVIRKYSGLLWKIAASVLINAGSAQDVEECVAEAGGDCGCAGSAKEAGGKQTVLCKAEAKENDGE